MKINFEAVIPKFDKILERGLCAGVGSAGGQMCIEAAITQAMDLPFNDQPSCVEPAVRSYKIALNDRKWTSAEARARGLRDLGIAQIGSAGVVDGKEFVKRLAEKTIRVLIPALFREVFADKPKLLVAADSCEREGSVEIARHARSLAYYADAAADAAAAAKPRTDKYLLLSASLALEVLRELKSPGCEWVNWKPA